MNFSVKNVLYAILIVFIILFTAFISFGAGKEKGKFEKTVEVANKLSVACFEELTKK